VNVTLKQVADEYADGSRYWPNTSLGMLTDQHRQLALLGDIARSLRTIRIDIESISTLLHCSNATSLPRHVRAIERLLSPKPRRPKARKAKRHAR
jgi:hypothetical protein